MDLFPQKRGGGRPGAQISGAQFWAPGAQFWASGAQFLGTRCPKYLEIFDDPKKFFFLIFLILAQANPT